MEFNHIMKMQNYSNGTDFFFPRIHQKSIIVARNFKFMESERHLSESGMHFCSLYFIYGRRWPNSKLTYVHRQRILYGNENNSIEKFKLNRFRFVVK